MINNFQMDQLKKANTFVCDLHVNVTNKCHKQIKKANTITNHHPIKVQLIHISTTSNKCGR